MKMDAKGLYEKLVLYVSLIVITVIAVFGFVSYKQQVLRIERNANESVILMAKNISLTCAESVIVNDYASINKYLERFAELPNVLETQIYDASGNILSDIVKGEGLQPQERYGSKPLTPPVSLQPSIQFEKGKLVALYPITAGTMLVGWARLHYGLREIPYIQRAILGNTVFISILGTLVSFVALLMTLKSPTRLIREIAIFAKRLDDVKGETIPVLHDFTEIEQLCEALNFASQQLYATEKALKQHRENLEELVALRTAEAARTNEQLQAELRERKQAEGRLKTYSEDLMRINEELKNFAYIVSHDLRAPLVNIKGFSHELSQAVKEFTLLLEKHLDRFDDGEKQRLEGLLKKEIPEALGFIGSSIMRMDALINSILKLSRLGRNELKPELVDTESVVHALLKSLAHQIDMHNVQITIGTLPEIIIDRTAIEHIFGNILDNALKYLGPARPGKIEVTSERNAEEAIFSIRDNGRGIAKDDIPKIFDLFRRAGRQDVPGEGMGLAYVKALVRRHGGRIWCESEPGVGTTFSFAIPGTRKTAL